MEKIIIHIGSDHAGYELKEALKKYLTTQPLVIKDYGTNSPDSVDYPDFAHRVGKAVNVDKAALGIVICGSGNGINMTVNKYPHVRSALCWSDEIAKLAKAHNNANVLALPARYLSIQKSLDIVKAFLNTDFEGGRHQNRVNKISSN